MNVIKVANLTKTFGRIIAVNNISYEVKEGTIFGLLGPNGAGKTTTIECMIGLKKPDTGILTILDKDVLKAGKKLYDHIGVQLQETAYQDKVKVSELCRHFEAMYHNPTDYRILLKRFHLEEKEHGYIQHLSGGQKQKIAIILALIANPQVVFLDELTTGLDPKARREMWEHVKGLKEEGRTVFLTTHYMEEAAYLCDKIGIIHEGKLVTVDDVEGVIEKAELVHQVSFESEEEIQELLKKELKEAQEVLQEGLRVTVLSTKEDIITPVVLFLHKHKIPHRKIDIKRPTLEDAYLKLTGTKWED